MIDSSMNVILQL